MSDMTIDKPQVSQNQNPGPVEQPQTTGSKEYDDMLKKQQEEALKMQKFMMESTLMNMKFQAAKEAINNMKV